MQGDNVELKLKILIILISHLCIQLPDSLGFSKELPPCLAPNNPKEEITTSVSECSLK